jgi:uncharacterized protein YjbJ (UPF0337 family)
MKGGRNLELLGRLLNNYNQAAQYARDNAGKLQETVGRVVDVDDPKEEGRIRVVINEVDPKVLEAQGFPQGDAKETESDWIEPNPAFKGKQPKSLVGLKVKIQPKQGDPNQMVFGDVVYDKADDPKAKMPDSSNMTRLPVYKAGELPPATKENVGCVIVESGGPQGYDWLMVCLNRGGYKWVRHIDRLHIHQSQEPDSHGDSEGKVNDDVEATT